MERRIEELNFKDGKYNGLEWYNPVMQVYAIDVLVPYVPVVLPCPVCGERAWVLRDGARCWVECEKCDYQTPIRRFHNCWSLYSITREHNIYAGILMLTKEVENG